MQKQVNEFVEKHLSPYLCGYRRGYNSQYALLAMIERWKMSLDNNGLAGGGGGGGYNGLIKSIRYYKS